MAHVYTNEISEVICMLALQHREAFCNRTAYIAGNYLAADWVLSVSQI